MTKTGLAILLMGTVALGACENAEQKAARVAMEQAALSVCPADQVISDVAEFTLDVPAYDNDQPADFHAILKDRAGVTTTETGLQYSVVKSGNPKGPQPAPTNTVKVNYHGVFPDGSKFDSSFDRGQPTEFPLNRVISGWTEGVGLMRPCDAWTFYIPSDLAYGPNGRPGIPGGATLLFHVQLLEVQ